MRSHLRQVASAWAVCLVCVSAALSPSSAIAGVDRWTAIGPDGADVVALVIDPANPFTAFAGTMGSGVLKTTDGGASWATVNQGLPTANVLALVKDPSHDTLYAGTDAGVFRSTDGGQSWAAFNDGLDGAPPVTVNALAIEPWDGKEGIPAPATVYAATSQGLFKSLKGAGPWTLIKVPTGFAARLITIDPSSPSTLYIGVDDTTSYVYNGVLKSTDGGTSWARIYTVKCGFMCDGAPSVAGLAVDPKSPSRLYVVGWINLAMSADGGASWSDIDAPSDDTVSLAVDPTSPATLYVGTWSGAVYRTVDAGGHWTSAADRLGGGSVNVIAMDASAPATIYAGGSTGVYRSSDAAQTWTQQTLSVRSTLVYPLAVNPGAPSTIYAGIGSSRVIMKTTDGGAHWADSGLGLSNHWVNMLAIDPQSPSTLYAASLPIFKTTDAGAHWAPVPVGLASIYETSILVIAPSQPSTLYIAGNFAGVLKSTDGGSSWIRANNGVIAVGVYIPVYVSALTVDPTDPDIVYLATLPIDYPDTPKVFKSTDGAAQWTQVPLALPTNTVITSLVIDPATPSTIYATYDNYGTVGVGVYKSNDGGETWITPTNLLRTTRISALAIDPTLTSRVYAATEDGVFRSTDGATTWTAINSGLPDVAVWALSIDPTGSLLRGATGIGLFEYQTGNAPGPPGTVPVIEYLQAAFGDYFITAIPYEIAKLDNGTIPGWARTGFQFNAYATPGAGVSPVCRFFNTAFLPKSPHFHTPFASECAAVQTDPDWLLESSAAFYIAVPAGDGSCPAGSTPVYRFYNNGQGGAPSHRYTTDLSVRAQMIRQGWVPEGLGADAVEMCSPQ